MAQVPDPDADLAWSTLLAARDRGRGDGVDQGHWSQGPLHWEPDAGWRLAAHLEPASRDLLDLYLPLVTPLPAGGLCVVGHLGQSLDGCIATASGASRGLNDTANIVHLHRLRALCDAIIVGAGTVAADDPQLTTRAVAGPNPLRVIIDPHRRLPAERRVFQDGAAPTLLCAREDAPPGAAPGRAELLRLPAAGTGLDDAALLGALAARGRRHLFVEGGGVTVTRFLRAGLLTRLQVAVAPLLLGAGRRGLSLPAATLETAHYPGLRVWRLGRDLLYDFDLLAEPGTRRGDDHGAPDLPRRLY